MMLEKIFGVIGFAFGLLWFIVLQFYWPPPLELTDAVVSAFFWPCVVIFVSAVVMALMRLRLEVRSYRFRLLTHNDKFATQVYFALCDYTDRADLAPFSSEAIRWALEHAYRRARKLGA